MLNKNFYSKNMKDVDSMTNEELRIEIAEFCGKDNLWCLSKRGLYYRPNGHGYTSNASEAWVLTEQEADKHTYFKGDEAVFKVRAPIPNYPSDLNAMWEAEDKLLSEHDYNIWKIWYEHLKTEVLKIKVIDLTTGTVCHATAKQRAIAFVKTIREIKNETDL